MKNTKITVLKQFEPLFEQFEGKKFKYIWGERASGKTYAAYQRMIMILLTNNNSIAWVEYSHYIIDFLDNFNIPYTHNRTRREIKFDNGSKIKGFVDVMSSPDRYISQYEKPIVIIADDVDRIAIEKIEDINVLLWLLNKNGELIITSNNSLFDVYVETFNPLIIKAEKKDNYYFYQI
jgi:hypothetical protein